MEKIELKLNLIWATVDAERVRAEKRVRDTVSDTVRMYERGKAQAYAECGAELRKLIAELRNVPA